MLAEEGLTRDFAPAGEFMLGEGYRFRASDGDETRALEHYTRSTEQYPDYAAAYGARGRVRARRGEHAAAVADLERFVSLTPEASDVPFALQTINHLKKESAE